MSDSPANTGTTPPPTFINNVPTPSPAPATTQHHQQGEGSETKSDPDSLDPSVQRRRLVPCHVTSNCVPCRLIVCHGVHTDTLTFQPVTQQHVRRADTNLVLRKSGSRSEAEMRKMTVDGSDKL